MVLGIGSFAASTMRILKEEGADVFCYLTRDYGHFGPSQIGRCFYYKEHDNPCQIVNKYKIDLLIPMSINWHLMDWSEELIQSGVAILSPVHDAMLLERDRHFAKKLCDRFGIGVPAAYVAQNRLEAENYLKENPRPYVMKNPLCSPGSPIHTIVCETVNDTKSWLKNIDYAEGVFLQEYMGRREAGHIGFVSDGRVYPMVTNQEYKRAFDGNMGPVAGAPLGGLVELDPEDKYGLVRDCLEPLTPWFRETNFYGPVQVTAAKRDGRWHVLEYNVRTGITTGPALWRMIKDPVDVIMAVARNQKLDIHFKEAFKYACNLTLCGWGYPYTKIAGPSLPVKLNGQPTCDIWWNEVDLDKNGELKMDGHRIADLVAHAPILEDAIQKVYNNIGLIRCLSSYYRLDIGRSMWPPGEE